MKVMLRVSLITNWGELTEVDIAEIQRPVQALDAHTLGLSLGEGKQIMQRLQQVVASVQTNRIL